MKPIKLGALPRGAYLALIAAVAVILGYSILVSLPFMKGPELELAEPNVRDRAVEIKGSTERVSFLKINGHDTPLLEDGTFTVERSYPPGYTAVTVLATDRFGRTITKSLHFVTHAYDSEEEK